MGRLKGQPLFYCTTPLLTQHTNNSECRDAVNTLNVLQKKKTGFKELRTAFVELQLFVWDNHMTSVAENCR